MPKKERARTTGEKRERNPLNREWPIQSWLTFSEREIIQKAAELKRRSQSDYIADAVLKQARDDIRTIASASASGPELTIPDEAAPIIASLMRIIAEANKK